jgi:hypothetical protein
MNCDVCGEVILIGYSYYHDSLLDRNYHIDCVDCCAETEDFLEMRYNEE